MKRVRPWKNGREEEREEKRNIMRFAGSSRNLLA